MNDYASHIVGLKSELTDEGARKVVRVHLVMTEKDIQNGKDASIAINNPINLKGFDDATKSIIIKHYGVDELAHSLSSMKLLKGVEQMTFYQFWTDLSKEDVVDYIMITRPEELKKYKIAF